ncbi:MAG: hypothetical protein KAH72_04640, partial [Flavobacteriaceae bacterium]|nr:hypothetical protein [Flavobacteriaceae bacterium]
VASFKRQSHSTKVQPFKSVVDIEELRFGIQNSTDNSHVRVAVVASVSGQTKFVYVVIDAG